MEAKKFILVVVMVLTFGFFSSAGAWVYVGPLGDTGWKTFTYTAGDNGFSGLAGFVVSNQGDSSFDSFLLLDNLSHDANPSFETGDYTAYTLGPSSFGLVDMGPAIALSGNIYNPTHGSYMSGQGSWSDDTSSFYNAFGQPGTNGSILETSTFTLEANGTFTFDWAFATWDDPTTTGVGYDFALFYLRDVTGGIVQTEGLAQVVPIPATLLLFGSGLLSLAGIGLRKKRII